MEVPEEELADLLVLTPLTALKIHGADWKSRMIGWSSTKLTVNSGAAMTFHLHPGGGRHFTRTGVFSTADVPRNMALNSCAPFPARKPHQKEDKDVRKSWGETRMEGWAHAIFLQWTKLLWQFLANICKTTNKPDAAKQKQEKNPSLQFSHPGVPPWDRRVLRDWDK